MADQKDPVAELFRCVDWQDNLDVEQALRELDRRAAIERRLEAWLCEDDQLRTRVQSALGVVLGDYRAGSRWFAIRGEGGVPSDADDWTATEMALDAAGAPK